MESKEKYDYSSFDMPANKVVSIYKFLLKNSIPSWLDGGWAVDALAHKQTRPHQDVDFLIPIKYTNKLINLFLHEGFIIDEDETELPYRLVVVNPSEFVMVDFHLVIKQKDNSMIFRITNYKENAPSYDYTYSSEGLSGVGKINDEEIPCITLDEQIRCRTSRKYSFEDPDRMRKGGINADVHDLDMINSIKKTNG